MDLWDLARSSTTDKQNDSKNIQYRSTTKIRGILPDQAQQIPKTIHNSQIQQNKPRIYKLKQPG